jgi:hypothetical protein
MKYITRELHRLMQGGLGEDGDREAAEAWDRACCAYLTQFQQIRSHLPPGMRSFAETTLHDGIVRHVTRPTASDLILEVDASDNPWGPRGRFRLTFLGVREVEGLEQLVGQGWLYQEVHLHSTAPFEYRVMFWRSDFRIVAEELFVAECPDE